MKTVNNSLAVSKSAAAVLEALFRMLPTEDAATRYIKLNKHNHPEGAFMPVSVQILGETEEGLLMSVAHYYEQHGDLMADPVMTFLRKPTTLIEDDAKIATYIPLDYQDTFGSKISAYFNENSTIRGYNLRVLTDLIHFTTSWMKNIKGQQGVKPVVEKKVHNVTNWVQLGKKAEQAAKTLGFDNLKEALTAGKKDEIASMIGID